MCTPANSRKTKMLIHNFLENSADKYPDKEAVIHGNSRFTFLDIEVKSNSISNRLVSLGINKGDRVALLLRNSIEYICSYYGILKSGAIAVPFNTGLDANDLGAMFRSSEPQVLITEKYFLKTVEELVKNNISCRFIVWSDLKDQVAFEKADTENIFLPEIYSTSSNKRPCLDIIDQDVSSIIYTSGSTGKPKGATLTHLGIVTNTQSILSYLRLTSEDRCMVVLPFYYVYGKTLLNTHFAVSGTVIIDNRFVFPNAVLKTMKEEKATGFSGVPSTFSILLNRSSIAKMKFPDLCYLTQAGGHMSAEHKKKLMKIFPDKKIFIMYGATEASARLSFLEPDQLEKRINSVGKPIPKVEMRIVKEDGKEAEYGEEGEIAARGANIMLGYWGDPEETGKVLKNGWYYTGDIGKQDKEGFFYITSRKRDIIKVDRFKVSANEIEEVLFRHPGIEEVAVIGIPDDVLGEAIKAFVVIAKNSSVSKDEIRKFCSDNLPLHKVPHEIEFIENLPKNEAGKVLKRKLQKS